MPASSPPAPVEPTLPPRPAPARSPGDVIGAWLAWFGLARLVMAAVSVAVVVAGAYWLLRAPIPDAAAALPVAASAGTAPSATLPPPSAAPPPATAAPGPLYVHVAGSVINPGVYAVPPGSRVDTAVGAAGGPTTDGDLDGLNLAASLADGQRVYVPAAGEVDPATVPDGAVAVAGGSAAPAGPLDLNTATAADLERLPGVGPATAAAIVDDRARNGPFATVDDLERVPGIGPAKLAALRDLVRV
ncbi:MAG TPA: ComEA family DNA-binding protein [Ilumatobacter sp.]|nr:ComEA family DNA-binding protein [Ilumatobacter sp.]